MEDKSSSGATAAVESGEANTSPAKKSIKSKAAKVQRPRSTHPSTSEMVNSAIKELKDRKGSSLQAIKKYIANTYKVDSERFAPFIKKYLKTAVTSGTVVQTKGKGASGSFKLSTNKTTTETKVKPQRPVRGIEAAEAKPVKKKTVTAQKATKKASPAKRSAAVEKKPVAQKKTAAKTTTAEKAKAVKTKAAQPKAISKTKKTAKAPAAKTKTPKPKKTAASKTVKSSPRK